MAFTISAPPHHREALTVNKIIWGKILALVPISLFSIYFFGLYALGLIIASILAAVATEFAIQKAFNHKVTIADGHAVLIGLMLALLLPPEVPIWMPMIGSLFAVGVGKHAFGDMGSYVFNPVLGAWVFLNLSWGKMMTPASLPHIGNFSDLIVEKGAGFLVGVSPIALLAAGIVLILMKYVDWRVPISFFVTTFLLLFLLKEDISYVITGVFFFGMLFILSDTAMTPITKDGRIVFGIACGLLTVVYGYFADYVFAVLYGLFLANSISPLIERITIPKSIGGVKK
ncbi:MAG: RnfABCDGE type electron transport complex subunit D [Methanosarcinaceae archaeon]|nr:RnfABCDGE type electron transport complex subunit D [Methanosarcinaceae archaeon]